MSGTKTTVTDNGVEVIFEFSNATINVGDSNIDTLLGAKADESLVDYKGRIWFTSKSGISPRDTVDDGGIDSFRVWEKIGTISLGTKTLYVWECIS